MGPWETRKHMGKQLLRLSWIARGRLAFRLHCSLEPRMILLMLVIFQPWLITFPKKKLVYKRVFKDFSHTTYFTGTPAAYETWYPDFHQLVHKYNPLSDEQNTTDEHNVGNLTLLV